MKIEGQRDKALRQSFPFLAKYISGKQREGPKISMTVPVMQTNAGRKNYWSVYFFMPSKYTYDSVPKPQDNDIEILELEQRKMATVSFRGLWNESLIEVHKDKLKNWIKSEGLAHNENIIYAFYNDPSTPGLLRRNEILIELK